MRFEESLQRVLEMLNARSFFKLICGGSFSDTRTLQRLIEIYAEAGVPMVDVSAAPEVVRAAQESLRRFANPPLLMVSFPLDHDPHFRKIQLVEADCIHCGLCVPLCPTAVFDLPEATATLSVETPLCYGCGRCLPVCPTEALKLDPFEVNASLVSVLAEPGVQAVEIHTTHADPVMLDTLYRELGPWLKSKLISVCLRPQVLPLEQVMTFLVDLKKQTPYPLIVQVDGIPMSGSDDPQASIPAMEAAKDFAPHLPEGCFLTVSGGINRCTADYLRLAPYHAIRGVGMGSAARQHVWPYLEDSLIALEQATALVRYFQSPVKSFIL